MNPINLTTFSHKHYRLVSGLFWQPLERPRNYMKEAREIGRREKMDIVTIRKTDAVLEAGFVCKQLGIVKGMYSLASIMADKLGNADNNYTFLAAVTIDEGRYAMVAVDKNGILPDSDRVEDLTGIQGAINKFYGLLKKPDIKVYAPSELGFGGQEIQLDSLLTNLSRHHRLRPLFFGLSKREVLSLSGVIFALLIVGTIGKLKYDQWQRAEQQRLEAARQALERVHAQTGVEHTVAALVHPWTTQPALSEFLHVCEPELKKLPLSVAGWTFLEARCQTSGLNVLYQRTADLPVTVDQVIEQALTYWPNAAVTFSADNNTAQIKYPLSFAPGGDDPLMQLNEIRHAIVSHFQARLILFSLAARSSEVQPLLGQADSIVKPTWSTWTFSTQSKLAATDTLKDFPSRGVRLTSLSVVLNNLELTWNTEGEFYAQ